MSDELKGKKVAILVENGFEQVELTEPKKAIEAAGAIAHIISPVSREVKAWKETDWGRAFPVDVPLAQARPDEYDALLLPGGVMNPDRLRWNPKALTFVRAFFNDGKPIAAICHGPWMLIDSEIAHGLRLTSYPSIKNDLKNAGAEWVDEEVVVDRGIVTSRRPADLPAFNKKIIEEFREGNHHREPAMAGTGVNEWLTGP